MPYRRSLELAVENHCRSIALPSLSTGAYRYPIDQAARVALSATIEFLEKHGRPELVRFVLFDATAYSRFEAALKKLAEKTSSLRDKNLSSKEKDEMFISLTDARRSAIFDTDYNNRGDLK